MQLAHAPAMRKWRHVEHSLAGVHTAAEHATRGVWAAARTKSLDS
jgi:hypothetical protein